ncbi:MAG: SLC13 family permease [Candidatus Nanohaloarchaea archaeon]|nr:SLC13 family permease [Candidatus Nanohaloarchaea archaeon]
MSLLPPGLEPGMVIVTLIVAVALVLFYTEIVPIDVTAIGIIVSLVVFGRWTNITPAEALSGFSSKATITILSFFIISEGVRETGIVQKVSRKIISFTKSDAKKQLAAITGISGTFSGFINNTAIVGILIPVVNDISEKTDVSASKLLMPMSFVAINAGQLTLVASTDNLIISEISGRLLHHPIGMFELTRLGAIMMLVSIVYFLTIGYRLVPDRSGDEMNLLEFSLKNYLTEVTVPEDSRFVGKTVEEMMEELDLDLDVQRITRTGTVYDPVASHELRPEDVLHVQVDRESLMKLLDDGGIDLVPETASDHEELEEEGAFTIIGAMLPPNSSLIGESLSSTNFRRHYEASVLAIRRKGSVIRESLSEVRFRAGDMLLLQADEDSIDSLAANSNFVLDRGSERISYRSEKAKYAVGIVAGVIALTALNILPVEIAGLAGVFGMVLTGCIAPRKIYDSVDWSIIFLVSGVIPLGLAFEKTGVANAIAAGITHLGVGLSPVAMLAVVYIVSQSITEIMNDSAAVVLLGPIAIEVARSIGADPFSFLLAVLFAAGGAVLTPIGFQTNLMIFGAGGYKFRDFVKVGLPLKIILTIVSVAGIYFFWGV